MEQLDGPATRVRLAAGIGGVFGFVMLLVFFVIGIKPQKTLAPKLEAYTATDKSFKVLGPVGWHREGTLGAGGNGASVKYDSINARVSIISDLQGSLMADVTRATDAQTSSIVGMMPGGENIPQTPRPPVEKMHIAYGKKMEDKWDEFAESEMKPLQLTLGECRVSEWTGYKKDSVGGSKSHGLRATILSGERLVRVTCYCSDDDWKILRETFSKIIRSLSPSGEN